MKLSKLHVANYRALRDVEIPLSRFVCLTGENNAGKSSVLQALSLFGSGSKIAQTNFFDPEKEITIALTLTDVQPEDLFVLIDDHRERIEKLVKDKTLVLVRRYATDGTSQVGYYDQLPTEARFQPAEVAKILKGTKGKAIGQAVAVNFPELADKAAAVTTHDAAKQVIIEFGQSLPSDKKQKTLVPLPTGGGFSIAPLLPEIIYIPAVKDLADDVKTTETSSFGKVLGIVLKDIIPLLKTEADLFTNLSRKLTRIPNERGEIEDGRLDDLRFIETVMESYVRESFKSVSLEVEIPPPKLESILSTARILADDGTKGPLETKGDGLRRAVVFAILRTYVALVERKAEEERKRVKEELEKSDAPVPVSPAVKRGYLLLYEEPELFLHPDAQRILFDALGTFSKQHHVVVTTHSPLFLGPEATATFVRISKQTDAKVKKPFAFPYPIDLSELGPKDEFQIICFENNNAAFFSRKVVLVEGDSDQIVFPHIAQLLNPEWNCARQSLAFVQMKGKGSIRRYRRFFQRFGVSVYVVSDLDLLIGGFSVLDPDEKLKALREALLKAVDAQIPVEAVKTPKADDIKDVQKKSGVKELWEAARKAREDFATDPAKFPALSDAVDKFFEWEKRDARLNVLRESTDPAVLEAKVNLLAELRERGVFVLSKGDIEAYYPAAIVASDKPSRAQKFRNEVSSREAILACCQTLKCPKTKKEVAEFELIFGHIFG